MKTILALSAAMLTSVGALAQNTAVINQSGSGGHGVTLNQRGSGSSAVVSQNNSGSGHQAAVTQLGAGNVATISQGGGGAGQPGQSVSVSQSGNTETHIDQTNGNNHIIINQTGEAPPDPADTLP